MPTLWTWPRRMPSAFLEESSHQLWILADLGIQAHVSGLQLLKRIRVDYPETAVVVMTAFGTVQTAVEAMKAGAYDYVAKPIHPFELKTLVKRSLTITTSCRKCRICEALDHRRPGFEQIVEIPPRSCLKRLAPFAVHWRKLPATPPSSYPADGTGKELVAKAVHGRAAGMLADDKVRCDSKGLLESGYSGHVKGSFTGALTHKKGKVEIADGGTLLLDEIGDMPLELHKCVCRV